MSRMLWLIVLLVLTAWLPGQRALAQAEPPPPVPGQADWSEVLHPDGSLRTESLHDLGQVQIAAPWMPDLPFIEGQASYHQFVAPDGSLVLAPSSTTLFFMALHPEESGLAAASGDLGSGLGYINTLLAGYIGPEDLAETVQASPQDFYQAMIAGQANLWTLDVLSPFLLDLLSLSLQDGSLYGMLLLYPPGECGSSPVGCPPQAAQAGSQTGGPPPAARCPDPSLHSGPIQISGGSAEGGKIAPPQPVVVGQDPERRGVDLLVRVLVPPVFHHTFQAVIHEEIACGRAPGGNGTGCPGHPGDPRFNPVRTQTVECVEHITQYEDRLADVQVRVSLTNESRQVILTELAQAYPGATLLHPDFHFSPGGGGSVWEQIIPAIPVADPGQYTVTVSIQTTGTPVSTPRSAQSSLGRFEVALLRVTLVGLP